MALKPSDSASESSTEASRAATQGAAAAPKPTPRAEAPLAVEVGSSVPGPPPLQTPLPRVSSALSRGQCLETPTNLQDGREAPPSLRRPCPRAPHHGASGPAETAHSHWTGLRVLPKGSSRGVLSAMASAPAAALRTGSRGSCSGGSAWEPLGNAGPQAPPQTCRLTRWGGAAAGASGSHLAARD